MISRTRQALAETTLAKMSANKACLKKIPPEALFVSEPDPRMFGNAANPRADPNWTNANWLKSKFHFAFAEWRSPFSNFGVLRVLNDDLVQPDRGFGTHGHSDMEIATIVLDGELSHKDSMGSEESLGRGSVQFMSAGYGVRHSEFNHHKTQPLRFLQLWILPLEGGLEPKYGGFDGTTSDAVAQRKNKWAHLVTWNKVKAPEVPIKLDQDVNIYVAEVEPSTELDFEVHPGRQAYVVTAEGKTELSALSTSSGFQTTVSMDKGDAAEAYGDVKLKFKGETPAFWVIVEMKWTGGRSKVPATA